MGNCSSVSSSPRIYSSSHTYGIDLDEDDEDVPNRPKNPFTDAECKEILKDWQRCVNDPKTNCWSLSRHSLRHCGGISALDSRQPFIGTSDLTLHEMSDQWAKHPNMTREQIQRHIFRQRKCQQYWNAMGWDRKQQWGSGHNKIHDIVYEQNCSDVPKTYPGIW